mmetsp:Transcript_14254/g.31136  ORF Transcript_14254/g.31136 Transcript_14254/m.31136 type:complete len:509 (-) Transcript_14254:60-1586(-)
MRIFARAFQRYPLTALTTGSASFVLCNAYVLEEITEDYSQHRLPRHYHWESISDYWNKRPISTTKRFFTVLQELGPVVCSYTNDFVLSEPASEEEEVALKSKNAILLREALTNLGPAFVKAGQQLSIRPDLVSPVVLKELQKLCDAVRPVPDAVAMQVIREELRIQNVEEVFEELSLVASASLGQVYKGKLRNNQHDVAIKVQRPNMRRAFSLDLFLLRKFGATVDFFTTIFTNQPPFHTALYESFSSGSYAELDYHAEAKNQEFFRHELAERNCKVVIPKVYPDFSTERVLTSEWINGKKLSDSPRDRIRQLIPVGVELFLTQLLDMGKFHSDPHPGNLLVNDKGELCLLDFGLCAEVDEQSRNAITKAIVHLLMRDFETLVSQDAIELGFLPKDFDSTELKPLLTKILTVGVIEAGSSDLRKRKKKLMDISNELNEIFFKYPFSVPPFFALVTRGLGLLEGIALTGDPDFDIFQASAPYARKRALALMGVRSLRQLTSRRSQEQTV